MQIIIAIILVNYLEEYKINSEAQFGFQKHKSTSDLLLLFSDFVNNKLNDRWHVIALFIDFSKAFDTLNLDKLINALESIGIRGNLLHWFMDYLTDRSILVKIGDKLSVKKYSTSGGSPCLGGKRPLEQTAGG